MCCNESFVSRKYIASSDKKKIIFLMGPVLRSVAIIMKLKHYQYCVCSVQFCCRSGLGVCGFFFFVGFFHHAVCGVFVTCLHKLAADGRQKYDSAIW